MKTLAPIGVTTYGRLAHLKQTITALQKNTLARQSELYIFSDAPQPGDEEIVAKVREYIHTVGGFKKVNIVERKINGMVTNSRGGIKQLLDQYGKIIFLEEDIVTAPGFLQFMNDALDFYCYDERILSITGYCPPIKLPENYNKDIFLLQRFSAWGFATWKDKFDPFDFEIEQHGIELFFSDKEAINKFKKNGEDMYSMLLKEREGKLDALDVKLMFYEFKYNMFTVYPFKSLTQNIGHDGTGVHCGVNKKFYHKELWDKVDNFEFVDNINVDSRIIKENYKFRSLGIKGKMVNISKLFRIYPLLK